MVEIGKQALKDFISWSKYKIKFFNQGLPILVILGSHFSFVNLIFINSEEKAALFFEAKLKWASIVYGFIVQECVSWCRPWHFLSGGKFLWPLWFNYCFFIRKMKYCPLEENKQEMLHFSRENIIKVRYQITKLYKCYHYCCKFYFPIWCDKNQKYFLKVISLKYGMINRVANVSSINELVTIFPPGWVGNLGNMLSSLQ